MRGEGSCDKRCRRKKKDEMIKGEAEMGRGKRRKGWRRGDTGEDEGGKIKDKRRRGQVRTNRRKKWMLW